MVVSRTGRTGTAKNNKAGTITAEAWAVLGRGKVPLAAAAAAGSDSEEDDESEEEDEEQPSGTDASALSALLSPQRRRALRSTTSMPHFLNP